MAVKIVEGWEKDHKLIASFITTDKGVDETVWMRVYADNKIATKQ